MPYRSLTHGRVRGAQSPPVNAHTNQVKAIESQKGVGNSGPIRKNNNNPRQSTVRTLSRNFLMNPNAYGPATFRGPDGRLYSNYSPGQGKGFPEATPLPSVGSVNRFARRAIARRAVTKRIGVKGSENCCIGRFAPKSTPPPTPTLNLTQSFTVQATNALQDINTLPSILNGVAAAQFYDPATITNGNNHIILWQPAEASNATLGTVAQWGSVDYGGSGSGSFILFEYEQGVANSVAIQIARPAGLVEGETVYTDNFNVKLTVTRASNSPGSHNAGDVQVLLDHPVAATQMQSGASPNHAVIQLGINGYGNSTAVGNTDNSAFIGNVSFNYSDIDFSIAAKRLQLNDILTLSITPV